jgi:hypothetical protein
MKFDFKGPIFTFFFKGLVTTFVLVTVMFFSLFLDFLNPVYEVEIMQIF